MQRARRSGGWAASGGRGARREGAQSWQLRDQPRLAGLRASWRGSASAGRSAGAPARLAAAVGACCRTPVGQACQACAGRGRREVQGVGWGRASQRRLSRALDEASACLLSCVKRSCLQALMLALIYLALEVSGRMRWTWRAAVMPIRHPAPPNGAVTHWCAGCRGLRILPNGLSMAASAPFCRTPGPQASIGPAPRGSHHMP